MTYLMLHMFLTLDQIHSINIKYQLIAQIFINFFYLVILFPHVSAHDGHIQGKVSYKQTRTVINVVKDVHK
jgi:hypothetical protein